jgi:gliding motility-associated-like protein
VSINHYTVCISSSNIDAGAISYDEAPASPVIDSVSVQLNGTSVYLGWQPSPSEDTDAYIIYSVANGTFTAIDTIYGIDNTFYTLTGFDPGSNSLSFAVSALDICLEEGLPADEHSTILLNDELNSCDGSVSLSWNEYSDWLGVSAYQVLQQVNGGAFSVVQTVAGNTVNTSIPELIPGAQYCYVVRAISSQGQASSTSNTVCFEADVQDLPDFAYLRKATVLPNGSAYSACIIDTASDIASYRVLRSFYPGNSFDTLYSGFIPPQVDEVNYTDFGVSTQTQSYTYIYQLIDKCGNASAVSNPGRTILLRGEALDGFVNRLRWNSYAEWDGGVGKYRLFRSLDGGSSFEMILDAPADSMFMDVVADQVDTLMTFCYYVEAVESQINAFGVRDTSKSNRVCVIQKPTVWIPSAFRPGNLAGNNTFKAIGLYEKLAMNHVFSIFNRWGEQLFITADPSEAWDGRYLSAIVPTGIYVYHLKFSLPDGTLFNKRGSVMVLD